MESFFYLFHLFHYSFKGKKKEINLKKNKMWSSHIVRRFISMKNPSVSIRAPNFQNRNNDPNNKSFWKGFAVGFTSVIAVPASFVSYIYMKSHYDPDSIQLNENGIMTKSGSLFGNRVKYEVESNVEKQIE